MERSRPPGHHRDPRSGADPDLAEWVDNPLPLAAYSELSADVFVNATSGQGLTEALTAVGAALDGTVLVDVSNPLDFSAGFPPTLFVSNTDSLAEQVQRRYPAVRVVKMVNTMANEVMVNPAGLAGGLRYGRRLGRGSGLDRRPRPRRSDRCPRHGDGGDALGADVQLARAPRLQRQVVC